MPTLQDVPGGWRDVWERDDDGERAARFDAAVQRVGAAWRAEVAAEASAGQTAWLGAFWGLKSRSAVPLNAGGMATARRRRRRHEQDDGLRPGTGVGDSQYRALAFRPRADAGPSRQRFSDHVRQTGASAEEALRKTLAAILQRTNG